MADYRSHLLAGAVVSSGALYLLAPYLAIDLHAATAILIVVLIGSLFPDIDHRSAFIHRKIRVILAILIGAFTWLTSRGGVVTRLVPASAGAATTILILELIKPKHRGITHTYRAAILYGLITGMVSAYTIQTFSPAIFGFIAYLSHLVLDRTVRF